jgi:hypothetical protein
LLFPEGWMRATMIAVEVIGVALMACGSGNAVQNGTGVAGASNAAAPTSGHGGDDGQGGAIRDDAGASPGVSAAGASSGAAGVGDTGGLRGTAGASGAAGVSGAGASVLDPSVLLPSHDCLNATSDCFAIAGAYGGAPLDTYCDSSGLLGVGTRSGKWTIGCKLQNSNMVELDVAIQRPGAFSETLRAGSASTAEFQFAAVFNSVTFFAENFERAELAGSVVTTPGSEYRVISGTFHGVWGAPESSCRALGGTECVAAELNVTFRVETRFGSCFSSADCAAPMTCNPIALACYN